MPALDGARPTWKSHDHRRPSSSAIGNDHLEVAIRRKPHAQ
jgi:hypothetical protein